MSWTNRVPGALVAPAIDAARRALRRLDTEEVPASLRKVASYAGGKLPPPLTRSLVRALDDDEWLRRKALDEWPDADTGAAGAVGASALFLLRPDGWEFRLGELAGRSGAQKQAGDRAALERDLEQARKKEAEARRRLQESQREVKRLEKERDSAVKQAVAEQKKARTADRARLKALTKEVAALEARMAGAVADLEGAGNAVLELRRRLQTTRRDRADLQRRMGEHLPASPWVGTDPLSIARHLDEVATASRLIPDGRVPVPQELPGVEGFGLPAGVSPDTAGAVEWLLGFDRPVTVLVDGYNVTFLVSESTFSEESARRYLDQELGTLKRGLPDRSRVVVVYDSSHGDGQVSRGPGGIEVRFTPAGKLADDELSELADASAGPTVVVSTDREVLDAATRAGAVGLWSEALVAWLRRRR